MNDKDKTELEISRLHSELERERIALSKAEMDLNYLMVQLRSSVSIIERELESIKKVVEYEPF